MVTIIISGLELDSQFAKGSTGSGTVKSSRSGQNIYLLCVMDFICHAMDARVYVCSFV